MNILQKAIRSMYSLTGSFNDKLLKYYKQYGATSSVLQDAEKQYLIGRLGAKYLTNQDYWKELDEQFGDGLPLEVSDILRKYGDDAHLYTFGPGVPILGPEMSPTAKTTVGWYGNNATVSSDGTTIRVVATIASNPQGRFSFPTVANKTYAVTAKLGSNNAPNSKQFRVGSADGQPDYGIVFPTQGELTTIRFVATGAVAYVSVGNGETATGQYSDWSEVSATEFLGYSNTYSGFVAGNYFDSAGTTHASVDGSVGLVLDAAGSVGAELLSNPGPFANTTGWTGAAPGTTTLAAVGGKLVITTSVGYGRATQVISGFVANKSYRLSVILDASTTQTYVETSGAYSSGSSPSSLARTVTFVFVATSSGSLTINLINTDAGTFQTGYVSIREVTGIHATQSTPGYKPTLRKGIVNLLTASDSTASATFYNPGVGTWTDNGLVSVPTPYGATQVRKITVTGGPSRLRWGDTTSGLINTAYTGGLWVATADGQTRSAEIYTNLGGVLQAITVTPTFQLFAQSGSNNGVNTHRFADLTNLPVGEYYIGRIGIFQGTLTAADILAAGGIPLTTTAPASSQAGLNYLEFDGVDDILTFTDTTAATGSLVFGICPKSRAFQTAFGVTSGQPGVAIKLRNNGDVWFRTTNGTTTCDLICAGVYSAGEALVLSFKWDAAGNNVAYKNGVQIGTVPCTSSPAGSATMFLGRDGGAGEFFGGSLFSATRINGSVPVADLLKTSKFIGPLSGVII